MSKIWLRIGIVSLVIFGAVETAFAGPPDVTITGFTHGGTGCPAGSVGALMSQNQDALTLLFDSFVAETPPGRQSRKNCQIAIDLKFDPAWSFTIVRVDYRGFAGLQAGALGEQKSTYWFQPIPPTGDVAAQTTIVGPFFNDYARSDNVGLLVWSPCDGTNHALVINAQVRVQGPDSQITVDSATSKVSQVYAFQWKPCH